MNVSVRSLLVPAVALATAGAVALSPALIAPPTAAVALPAVQIPAVHIADIQLAGIGRDFYNDVTFWVQEGVGFTSDIIRFGIPFVGAPIADQIDINYFFLIQPIIADTVYYLSDIFANPFNFIGLTGLYGSNLFYTGYEWVDSQARFFGLPPLPFLPAPPPLASVAGSSTPLAASSTAKGSRSAAVVVEVPAPVGVDVAELAADVAAGVTPGVTAEVPADVAAPATTARAVRGELGRAAKSAAAGATAAAESAGAEVSEAAQQTGAQVSTAVQGAVSEVRSSTRATRGAVGRAVTEARASVQAAADSASDAASDATN